MLGSYYNMPDSFYQPPSAGTPMWQEAPVPGWGVNPMRAGPPRVGVGADEATTIDMWRPERHLGGGIPEQDRVLPHYTPIGGCAGCVELGAAEEDVYKQTTWGHVALATAGGILVGMLFMYLYMAAKD